MPPAVAAQEVSTSKIYPDQPLLTSVPIDGGQDVLKLFTISDWRTDPLANLP